MTAALILDRENRIVCCFLAAILHELGHLLCMRLRSVRVRGFRLRLFDFLIEADEPGDFSSELLITAGGPAASFISAAVFMPFSPRLSLPNLALGIFNLLPVMSLDGGRLLYLLLERRFSLRICGAVLRITTFIFMLPLSAAGIYLLMVSRYNYSLLAISLYLLAVLIVKR